MTQIMHAIIGIAFIALLMVSLGFAFDISMEHHLPFTCCFAHGVEE